MLNNPGMLVYDIRVRCAQWYEHDCYDQAAIVQYLQASDFLLAVDYLF